jgi:hypothetical protein
MIVRRTLCDCEPLGAAPSETDSGLECVVDAIVPPLIDESTASSSACAAADGMTNRGPIAAQQRPALSQGVGLLICV